MSKKNVSAIERIAHQKVVASEVLSRLKVIDKNAILAGGAPGDWLRGIPARDLDFYIQEEKPCFPQQKLESLGFEVQSAFDKSKWVKSLKQYTRNPHIEAVKNYVVDGVDCQFIFVTCPVLSLIDKFALNTSQVWWDGEFTWKTDDYKIFEQFGVVYQTGEIFSREREYLAKVSKKYKGYKFYPEKEDFALDFLGKYLAGTIEEGFV